ncbi:MAG TPA: TetR family transcriptional regulator [Microbacterium sp.]|nr:TetR family transcriptional regulator [Microbacterium sp.]
MSDGEPGTRDRILEIAFEEFAEKGIAGTRVATIAARAGANVRMIYYWFGSKRGLHETVGAYAVRHAQSALAEVEPAALAVDPMRALFGDKRANPKLTRLLQWEELESADSGEPLANAAERAEKAAQRIALIERAQAEGLIAAELDPRMIYFALHALTRAPSAFPALARIATSRDRSDPEFAERYRRLLVSLGPVLAGDRADG